MNLIEKDSDTLDVLLHGSSGGMMYSLMQKIFKVCVDQSHSVVNFNFPYFERGEEVSSGPDLAEELETLKDILNQCHAEKYEYIRLIGKSLGAIIAARFLGGLSDEEQKRYSIVVFGYIAGETILNTFKGNVVIIQGEKDRFGDINVVKKDLENSESKDISYLEVKGGDHSYRNDQKEPIYEAVAIDHFRKI
jgi:predicted alpha/beta-hydrolase family hydrolase